jgi:hypothetical protein
MMLDINTQVKLKVSETTKLETNICNYSSNILKYENYVFSSLKETHKSNYENIETLVTLPNLLMFWGINSDLLHKS